MIHINPARPRIAIVPRISGPHAPAPPNVISLVETIGASPYILPLGYSLEGLDDCAGLFLQGGDDVLSINAALSGESASAPRDLAEYAAVQRALQVGLGIVGVCRGMQLINRYLGGTDAAIDVSVNAVDHGSSSDWTQHDVAFAKDSLVARSLGLQRLRSCSSHHTRAVQRLGLGLRATGWAADGCIEAIEAVSGRVLGFQWHPEDTAGSDPIQASLVELIFSRP